MYEMTKGDLRTCIRKERKPGLLNACMSVVARWLERLFQADPDVVHHAVMVSVWGRWYIWLVGAVMLARRPDLWYPENIGFLYINLSLAVANGVVHYRILDPRAGDLALDAGHLLRRHCADHGLRCRQRQIRQLRLRYLLSGPRLLCRGLLFPLAHHGLGDGDGRRLHCGGCGRSGAWTSKRARTMFWRPG